VFGTWHGTKVKINNKKYVIREFTDGYRDIVEYMFVDLCKRDVLVRVQLNKDDDWRKELIREFY
jgi:hypothetical protein